MELWTSNAYLIVGVILFIVMEVTLYWKELSGKYLDEVWYFAAIPLCLLWLPVLVIGTSFFTLKCFIEYVHKLCYGGD